MGRIELKGDSSSHLDSTAETRRAIIFRHCVRLGVAFLLGGFVYFHFFTGVPSIARPNLARGEIEWHGCENYPDKFECGTLVAPLDYTNPDDLRNATIALIRYKAGGGGTPRSKVLGSIILNPGGPGGSGLAFLGGQSRGDNTHNMTVSEYLDNVAGSVYDLVSFDPRGVGATWPNVKCIGDPLVDLVYEVITATNGLPGQHASKPLKHELGTLIAEAQLLGEVCYANKDSELFGFMSTSFVARDMQLMHRALGDPKLNYWGFSYGSVLGSVYADTFPDDVGRLIIDGVVDLPNYMAGLWTDGFKDIDAEFSGFFNECYNSGEKVCKLASLASSGEELRETVLNFGNTLKYKPLPVATAFPPQLLTYSTFITNIFAIMYSPNDWTYLADGLYELIVNGNSTAFVGPIDTHPKPEFESEAFYGIACGDVLASPAGPNGTRAWSISDVEHHMKPMIEDTEQFAPFFGRFGVFCHSGWQSRAVERHNGNFTSVTSFPILALGNDYDPVTPGRFADKMASLFPNAVSVRREGYGHCSFSQSSKCIERVVHRYFVEGEVPEPGLKCEVDGPVFGSPDETSVSAVAQAIHEINRKHFI